MIVSYSCFSDKKLAAEDYPRIRRKLRWIHLRMSKNKSVYCYPDGYHTDKDCSFQVTNAQINDNGDLVSVNYIDEQTAKVVCLTNLILFSEDNWFTDTLPYVSDYISAITGVYDEADENVEPIK